MNEGMPLLSSTSTGPSSAIKTYPPIVATAFTINFIFGAGVMGLPYAYQKAGIGLSSLFLCFISVLLLLTMTYIMEAGARAQGIVAYLEQSQLDDEENNNRSIRNRMSNTTNIIVDVGTSGNDTKGNSSSDRFLIQQRKFEINELCGIFLSVKVSSRSVFRSWADSAGNLKIGQRFYEFSLFLYSLGSLWLYATIFASSLTIAIPLPFLSSYKAYVATHNGTVPNPGVLCRGLIMSSSSSDPTSVQIVDPYCESAYGFFLLVYALFMLPMCCAELVGQVAVQMTLTSLAVVSIIVMVLTCIHAMVLNPAPVDSGLEGWWSHGGLLFNWSQFGKIFSTALFAQLGHQGIPGLVQLVSNKHKARGAFVSAVAITGLLFLALGTSTALYFGNEILPIITLHWRTYTGGYPESQTPLWAQVIRYFIPLFPCITVSATFPLNCVTLAENLLMALRPPSLITTSSGRSSLSRFVLRYGLRLLLASAPIYAASLLRDISKILEVCGLFAFTIGFWTPCALMYFSQRMCVDRFGPQGYRTPYHWRFSENSVVLTVLVFSMVFFVATFRNVMIDLIG